MRPTYGCTGCQQHVLEILFSGLDAENAFRGGDHGARRAPSILFTADGMPCWLVHRWTTLNQLVQYGAIAYHTLIICLNACKTSIDKHLTTDEEFDMTQNGPNTGPKYDGNCAFAVRVGKLDVPGKHEAVIDGTLYRFSNLAAKWLFRVLPNSAERADANWDKARRSRNGG